jgi:redox-sensitive bicupin YhaK (pirin superfamily)
MRMVRRVVAAVEQREGAGFLVHRPFPSRGLDHLDPFLLLDEMGPVDVARGEAKGAPDHPHRGFETVTYLLDGAMEHKDSAGHAGRLGPGDVQWMTAGRGVVHSEMPAADFQARGGRVHGFQLWVNLPRRDKMLPARYQEIPAARIPTATEGPLEVRVLAGAALGVAAAIETRTPITYFDAHLTDAGFGELPVPPGQRGFAYVYEGAGDLAGTHVERGQLAVLGDDGDALAFRARAPLRFLLVAGQPLREPIVRYGPFVMSTQGEILQALEDFRTGRMGIIS